MEKLKLVLEMEMLFHEDIEVDEKGEPIPEIGDVNIRVLDNDGNDITDTLDDVAEQFKELGEKLKSEMVGV
jgi:hypothetical protein